VKTHSSLRKGAYALGFALISSLAHGVTVVDDGFETGTHPTGFRTVATGTGVAVHAVNTSNGTMSSPLAVDPAFAGGAGNRVLGVYGTANYPIIATLGGNALLSTVSDSITLSFDFRLTNTPLSAVGGFRFGLANSNGTLANFDGSGSASDNDSGYYVTPGVSGSTPAANNYIFNEAGGTSPILAGLDRAALTASAAGANIADMNVHSVSLSLTRDSLTTILISLTIDSTTWTATDSSANLRTSFDEIAFNNGFATTYAQYNLDNLKLTATNFVPIPEPAFAGLVGIGVLSFLQRRRLG
jgi:hypothetical protein